MEVKTASGLDLAIEPGCDESARGVASHRYDFPLRRQSIMNRTTGAEIENARRASGKLLRFGSSLRRRKQADTYRLAGQNDEAS